MGQCFKSQGQKSIPGQNCRRLAVNFVIGGLAPPKVVVVHGGQIVMNKGICVNHLKGGRRQKEIFPVAPHSVGCGHQKDGAQAFAPCHKAVLHGFFQRLIKGHATLQFFLKAFFGKLPPPLPYFLKIHNHSSINKGWGSVSSPTTTFIASSAAFSASRHFCAKSTPSA